MVGTLLLSRDSESFVTCFPDESMIVLSRYRDRSNSAPPLGPLSRLPTETLRSSTVYTTILGTVLIVDLEQLPIPNRWMYRYQTCYHINASNIRNRYSWASFCSEDATHTESFRRSLNFSEMEHAIPIYPGRYSTLLGKNSQQLKTCLINTRNRRLSNFDFSDSASLEPVTQPRQSQYRCEHWDLWMARTEFRVHCQCSGIQLSAKTCDPVQTAKHGSRPYGVEVNFRARSPRIEQRRKAKQNSKCHGLSIVELGVRRPFRIEDVGMIPVSKERT